MAGGSDKYPWQDEDIALIKKLLLEGLSRALIAAELPIRQGIKPTRNAVIGKISRHPDLSGFLGRAPAKSAPAKSAPRRPRQERRVIVGPKPSKPLPVELPPPPPAVVQRPPRAEGEEVPAGRAAVLGLRYGDCKWPFGDPRSPGFRFCCADRLEERPYCAAHTREAYIPLAPKPQRRPHRGRV